MNAKFQKVLADFVCLDDQTRITEETDLLEDFQLDSLDRFDLFYTLEKEFGVQIEDEEAVRLRTVGDFWELIAAKLVQG
jgi:acyl carrier protein